MADVAAPQLATVSRGRVFQAAQDLDCGPDSAAQIPGRERSGNLGVLFALGQPYDVAVVEAIYPAAERLGYDIVLGAASETPTERTAVDALLNQRVEAVIVVGPYLARGQLTDLAQQIPVIQIGRRVHLPASTPSAALTTRELNWRSSTSSNSGTATSSTSTEATCREPRNGGVAIAPPCADTGSATICG